MTGIIFLTCTSLHFLFSFLGCFSCPGHKFFAILRSTLLQHGYSSLGFLHHTQNALQHLHSQKHHKKSIRLSTNHGSFSLQLNEKKITVSTCRQSSTSLGILGSPKGSWELGSPSRCPKYSN